MATMVLRFSALLAAAVAVTARHSLPLLNQTGVTSHCVGGQEHRVQYRVTGPDANSFVDLDSDKWRRRLDGITCDVDHTRLSLHFRNGADATEWIVRFHDLSNHFIVGGAHWNCSAIPEKDGYILRQLTGSSENAVLGRTITLHTSMARYDQVYESAEISFSTHANQDCDDTSNAQGSVDKQVCLQYNGNCASGAGMAPAAAGPLPLYKNSHITTTCSNCFAQIVADVFVEMKISDWQLKSLSGGFRNVSGSAALVATAEAEEKWSAGVDKTLSVMPQSTLLNFKVGPVPFALYFAVPMEVQADASFDSQASATFGATTSVDVGDATISWDADTHWQFTRPEPKFSWLPVLGGTTTTQGSATISLNPSFEMHFDRVFSYTLAATPSLRSTLDGSSSTKQVCVDSSYTFSATSYAELDINIPIANYHKDLKWGPQTIATAEGQLVKKCIKVV